MLIDKRIHLMLLLFISALSSATAFSPMKVSDVDTTKQFSDIFSSSELIPSRRSILKSLVIVTPTITTTLTNAVKKVNAAPPIAIIAEELGYFPITNRKGITQYVAARVKRSSTDQSVDLAKFLSSKGVKMYGTYWCGHTRHQKELFGKEAWDLIQYVECSPNGVYYDAEKFEKVAKYVDGFPTWYIPGGRGNGQWVSGEMPLERIAALSGYKGVFDVALEGPDGRGVGSC